MPDYRSPFYQRCGWAMQIYRPVVMGVIFGHNHPPAARDGVVGLGGTVMRARGALPDFCRFWPGVPPDLSTHLPAPW
jgi:hypothetical protein